MNNVELVRTLSWRENALFEEREKNVFVKPNEQCRACSDIVMARKRTFRETKKKVFVKPNEQCRVCSDIVMARKRTFRETRKEGF